MVAVEVFQVAEKVEPDPLQNAQLSFKTPQISSNGKHKAPIEVDCRVLVEMLEACSGGSGGRMQPYLGSANWAGC